MRLTVYVFRDPNFTPAGDTLVSVAAFDLVASVYGGDLAGGDGLVAAFGGAALFKSDETGERFLGVWGKRNAARFRRELWAAGKDLTIVRTPPPARLSWFKSSDGR